jgi:hypothetical protein
MGRRVEDLLIERRLNGQAGRSPVVLGPEGQAADSEVLLTGTGCDAERREVYARHVRNAEPMKLPAELGLHALIDNDDTAAHKALKRLA